jgi:hypothetical protein
MLVSFIAGWIKAELVWSWKDCRYRWQALTDGGTNVVSIFSRHILSVVLTKVVDDSLELVLDCVDSGPVLGSWVLELESSRASSARAPFD